MASIRYARRMELHDHGPVFEILPHIFAKCSRDDNPTAVSAPFFDRFARVRQGRVEALHEISQGLFQDALSLLAQTAGGFDLAPGMDWHENPVGFAALIAAGVHLNQQDKLGFPYIEHPRRVYLNSEWSLNPEDLSEAERIIGYQAAWLHDVLEDSKEFFYRELTNDDLAAWGFGARVLSVVSKLTRTGENQDESYYRRILLDTIARAVKLADIADNLASWRVALLPDQTKNKLHNKYQQALEALLFDNEDEGEWFELRLEQFDEGPWPVFALAESHQALRRHRQRGNIVLTIDEACPPGMTTWQFLDQIEKHAYEIIQKQVWSYLDPADLSPNWPYEISLEAWYTAYLILYSRAEAGLGSPDEAERLGSFIDRLNRSEASFQVRHFGLLPRDIRTADVKLRLPRAIQFARTAIDAMSDEFGNPDFRAEGFSRLEKILQGADSDVLLDTTVILFADGVATWMQPFLKHTLVELETRLRKPECPECFETYLYCKCPIENPICETCSNVRTNCVCPRADRKRLNLWDD